MQPLSFLNNQPQLAQLQIKTHPAQAWVGILTDSTDDESDIAVGPGAGSLLPAVDFTLGGCGVEDFGQTWARWLQEKERGGQPVPTPRVAFPRFPWQEIRCSVNYANFTSALCGALSVAKQKHKGTVFIIFFIIFYYLLLFQSHIASQSPGLARRP